MNHGRSYRGVTVLALSIAFGGVLGCVPQTQHEQGSDDDNAVSASLQIDDPVASLDGDRQQVGARVKEARSAGGESTASLFASICVITSGPVPTPATHPVGVQTWRIQRGSVMTRGDFCQRGKILLYMQPDGNLVVYDENYDPSIPGRGARWASNTLGTGHHTSFQPDGNLVVYDASNRALSTGKVPSNTWRVPNPSYDLHVQADGNLVIYGPGWAPIWFTSTNH